MEQKFTEFSKIRVSERSMKHQMGLILGFLYYLYLPGTEVDCWFLIQEIVSLNTIFCKKYLTNFVDSTELN